MVIGDCQSEGECRLGRFVMTGDVESEGERECGRVRCD